jgi:hypothetical protein
LGENDMTITREEKRNYNATNMTWSFPDGSGLKTEEQRMNMKLLDMKWRIRNLQGKPNIKEMIKDFANL